MELCVERKDVHICVLKTDDSTLKSRYEERGSEQSEKFIQGRETKYGNLLTNFYHVVADIAAEVGGEDAGHDRRDTDRVVLEFASQACVDAVDGVLGSAVHPGIAPNRRDRTDVDDVALRLGGPHCGDGGLATNGEGGLFFFVDCTIKFLLFFAFFLTSFQNNTLDGTNKNIMNFGTTELLNTILRGDSPLDLKPFKLPS